ASILRFDAVKSVYANISMQAAQQAQRQHWLEDIFNASFTEAELAHAVEMVEQRQRAGLPVRWYFAFWTVIYNRLIETICQAYRSHPQRLAQLLVPLSKAVLFDVEIFTAVYFHAADRASAQQLNQHADHFEREVSDLVKSVAASVSSLHDTAQSMSAAAVAT